LTTTARRDRTETLPLHPAPPSSPPTNKQNKLQIYASLLNINNNNTQSSTNKQANKQEETNLLDDKRPSSTRRRRRKPSRCREEANTNKERIAQKTKSHKRGIKEIKKRKEREKERKKESKCSSSSSFSFSPQVPKCQTQSVFQMSLFD
jgi:hypothetical protein